MGDKIDLAQFIERMPALMHAFAADTRQHGETDETFNQSRTVDDWCREMAAWVELGLARDVLRWFGPRVVQ